VEATARDVTEAAARKKAALETKMSELESDLRMATTDLAMTSRQFSQVMNQLQVATEEVSRLQDSNAKLSQDHDGTLGDPPPLTSSVLASCQSLTRCSWLLGMLDPHENGGVASDGQAEAKRRHPESHREGGCP
jgi:septal ring factor EnvC (AmiA/AmiB activator)